MPPANEHACTSPIENPKSRAKEAPKPDPAAAPSISGETSGFLNIPWYAAPATERPHPHIITAITLGRRILNNTVSVFGSFIADGS